MTLCIVWRTKNNICFASDSRLSKGLARADAGTKVCRVPYSIFGPGEDGLIVSGDLGMAFSGHHDMGMDGIADIMQRGFRAVSRQIGVAIGPSVATCVVFAGHCTTQGKLRAFQMERTSLNKFSFHEVLHNVDDLVAFGDPSAKDAVMNGLGQGANQIEIIAVLKGAIDDEVHPGVGGAIQYGDFADGRFQLKGVAHRGETGDVHYWRGPLDLNGHDFSGGLIPRFPVMNMIETPSDDVVWNRLFPDGS